MYHIIIIIPASSGFLMILGIQRRFCVITNLKICEKTLIREGNFIYPRLMWNCSRPNELTNNQNQRDYFATWNFAAMHVRFASVGCYLEMVNGFVGRRARRLLLCRCLTVVYALAALCCVLCVRCLRSISLNMFQR